MPYNFPPKVQALVADYTKLQKQATEARYAVQIAALDELKAHPPYPTGTTFKSVDNKRTYRIVEWGVNVRQQDGTLKLYPFADCEQLVKGKVKERSGEEIPLHIVEKSVGATLDAYWLAFNRDDVPGAIAALLKED